MGIGMFVCKNVLDCLKGTVGVSSKPRGGTTVSMQVTLPAWKFTPTEVASRPVYQSLEEEVSAALGSSQACAKAAEAKHINKIAGTKPSVLLVDDTVMNNTLGKKMLLKQDCLVTQAFDGREALEIMKSETFTLVLMDMNMPVMDGKESVTLYRVWEKEHRRGYRQRIYAYTANCSPADQVEYVEAGCDGFVARPCNSSRFRDLISGEGSSY